MSDLFSAMFNRTALIGTGAGFLFIGAVVWGLPRVFKSAFAVRGEYATRLRAAGEERRAEKIEADTETIRRRVPIYGVALVAAGIVAIVTGFIATQ